MDCEARDVHRRFIFKDNSEIWLEPYLKMLQLALLKRVPFGKFNRTSAFPVATRLEDFE
jgi:hypothetical protein